jgi:hypothetical protein
MQKPAFKPGPFERAADVIINPIADAFYETGKLYKGFFKQAINSIFRGMGVVSKPFAEPAIAAINSALRVIFDPAYHLIQGPSGFAHTAGADELDRAENEVKKHFPNNPEVQQAIMRSLRANIQQLKVQLPTQTTHQKHTILQKIKSTIIERLQGAWKIFGNEIKNFPTAIANAFINSFKSTDFHQKRIPQEFTKQIQSLGQAIQDPTKQKQFYTLMIQLANRIIHQIPNN